jgi:FkbM family methyltransferase
VTWFFYERGWRGINVEPNAELHAALEAARPRDINLQLGISDHEGLMKFRLYPARAGLSTFSNDIMVRHDEVSLDYVDQEIFVTTLDAMLRQYDARTIEFLKIDVEGHELEVISGNEWTEFRPKVVIIEGGDIQSWGSLMDNADYILEFFDGLNYYYVAEEQRANITIMRYADRILSRRVCTWHEMCTVERYEAELARLRALLTPAPSTSMVRHAATRATTVWNRLRHPHR